MWWKYLIAAVVIMHGLGHLAGVGAAFTPSRSGFADKPWIFSRGVTVAGAAGKVFSLVWLAAVILLVASGIGLIAGQPWCTTAAIAGAIFSLVAIVPWWQAVVPGARAGALLDVVILVALLGPWKEQVLSFLH